MRARGFVNWTSEIGAGIGSRMFATVGRLCCRLRVRSSSCLHGWKEDASTGAVEVNEWLYFWLPYTSIKTRH